MDDVGIFAVDCNFLLLATNIMTCINYPQPPLGPVTTRCHLPQLTLQMLHLTRLTSTDRLKWKQGKGWPFLLLVTDPLCEGAKCFFPNKMLQILWADGDVGSLKQIFPLAAIRPGLPPIINIKWKLCLQTIDDVNYNCWCGTNHGLNIMLVTIFIFSDWWPTMRGGGVTGAGAGGMSNGEQRGWWEAGKMVNNSNQ